MPIALRPVERRDTRLEQEDQCGKRTVPSFGEGVEQILSSVGIAPAKFDYAMPALGVQQGQLMLVTAAQGNRILGSRLPGEGRRRLLASVSLEISRPHRVGHKEPFANDRSDAETMSSSANGHLAVCRADADSVPSAPSHLCIVGTCA